MSVHRFSYQCLESDAFQCSVHVVLHDIHVEVEQAHPVLLRPEFALCWSDTIGFGWVGEKVINPQPFWPRVSLAKTARYSSSLTCLVDSQT